MDILAHIKEEHKEFKGKMAAIEVATGSKKTGLFRSFYAELHGHHKAEEKVVFPLIKEKKEEESLKVVLEMIEEHNLVSHQFSIIEKIPVDDETWNAKFSVLKEVLEHHMEEEEEDLFPMAKKMISKETLVKILDEFESVHEKNTKEMEMKLK